MVSFGPSFNVEPEVVGAAIMSTAILATVVLVVVMVLTADRSSRCGATSRGWRCVHDEDHPGSHRDEHGQYWND